MWWTSLLKKIALARLAQTGMAGQFGASYLNRLGQQTENPQMNRLWTFNEDEGIPGMDWLTQGQSLPYNQQYLNRLMGSQYGNRPESFQDLLFKLLLNNRR